MSSFSDGEWAPWCQAELALIKTLHQHGGQAASSKQQAAEVCSRAPLCPNTQADGVFSLYLHALGGLARSVAGH